MTQNVFSTTLVFLLILFDGSIGLTPRQCADTTLMRAVTPDGDSLAVHRHAVDVPGGLRIEATGVRLGTGELREPLGLDVDNRGFVFVADAMAGKVFRYTRAGESIEFGRPSRFTSFYPIDIAAFGPYVYVLDYIENRVLRFDYKGAYLDILLSFTEYERMHPVSITTDEGGRIVTTDVENHTLSVWSPLLDLEFSLGEYGWMEGDFDRPMKAVVLPDGRLAVVETGNRRLQLFSAAGGYEASWTAPDSVSFRTPRYVCFDRAGNTFVADATAGRVIVFSRDGEAVAAIDSFDGEPISPAACACDWNDYLYVADLHSRSVLVFRLRYFPE